MAGPKGSSGFATTKRSSGLLGGLPMTQAHLLSNPIRSAPQTPLHSLGIGLTDRDYMDAGATILSTAAEVSRCEGRDSQGNEMHCVEVRPEMPPPEGLSVCGGVGRLVERNPCPLVGVVGRVAQPPLFRLDLPHLTKQPHHPPQPRHEKGSSPPSPPPVSTSSQNYYTPISTTNMPVTLAVWPWL